MKRGQNISQSHYATEKHNNFLLLLYLELITLTLYIFPNGNTTAAPQGKEKSNEKSINPLLQARVSKLSGRMFWPHSTSSISLLFCIMPMSSSSSQLTTTVIILVLIIDKIYWALTMTMAQYIVHYIQSLIQILPLQSDNYCKLS